MTLHKLNATAQALLGDKDGRDLMVTAAGALQSMALASGRPRMRQVAQALSLISSALQAQDNTARGGTRAAPLPGSSGQSGIFGQPDGNGFVGPAAPETADPFTSPAGLTLGSDDEEFEEEVNQVCGIQELRGPVDAANCDVFRFSLYQSQLVMAGPQRGMFELDGLRNGAEVLLFTAAGAATPVVLRRTGHESFTVCVRASPPREYPPLQATS